MTIKLFAPKLEVRLIKTDCRDELAPGQATAARYGKLQALDLTPYLFEGATVLVQRHLREPAGVWSFALADRMLPEFGETLYALIEPQDMIEIRIAREPNDPAYGGSLPIVMRGFVSRITRRRAMTGGRPQRVVQVSGHDLGKLLQILRIYYLSNSVVGDNIIGELSFFQKFAGLGQSKIMAAAEFVQLVLDKVINPYIARLTKAADGSKVGAAAIHAITADVSIEGAVSPFAVSAFAEGSVYEFLARFLDVGPFNEMFIDDRGDGVHLVLRPVPLRGVDGKVVQQGVTFETVEIDASHIEDISESRSDESVANYFWVTNAGWQLIDNASMKQLADASPTGDYLLIDYPNSHAARYGFRKMEVESQMGPVTLANSDAVAGAQKQTETDKRKDWLVARRRTLAGLNKDNVVFESGQMTLRGNEKIKCGVLLQVNYGNFTARYYVTQVSHQFTPFGAFKTTIGFERGTGFIARAQRAQAPYLAEMDLKGLA